MLANSYGKLPDPNFVNDVLSQCDELELASVDNIVPGAILVELSIDASYRKILSHQHVSVLETPGMVYAIHLVYATDKPKCVKAGTTYVSVNVISVPANDNLMIEQGVGYNSSLSFLLSEHDTLWHWFVIKQRCVNA